MNRYYSPHLSSISDPYNRLSPDLLDPDRDGSDSEDASVAESVTEEDSDEEPEEDEEECDGETTQQLIAQVDASFLDLLIATVERVEKEHDNNQRIQIRIEPPKVIVNTNNNSRDEETQTDSHHQPQEQANDSNVSDPVDIVIRNQIASLRVARDCLVNQRKEVADRMKLNNVNGGEHRVEDEKKIYEFEEAIEAIDSVIEFRNEALCGRECILSNCIAPGRNEADLVTHLTNLSKLDLQRLVWKYYSKVVELRYSSKRFERNNEELENAIEHLELRYARLSKQIKEMQTEYEQRIKMFISMRSINPNTALEEFSKALVKKLSTSERMVYDLQAALSEILVGGSYLTNRTDYDVKHIVKRLGIDAVQKGLNWGPEERIKKKGDQLDISSNRRHALQAGLDSQGLSRRMRAAYEQGHSSHHSHHHHHPSHHHHHPRDRSPMDAHDPHHLHTQEVRRKGRQKLVIQPRSSSPHPP